MCKIVCRIIDVIKEFFTDKEKVVVRENADSRQGKSHSPHGRKRRSARRRQRHDFRQLHSSKPRYKVLEKGSVLFVDGANLLGAFDPSEAMHVLSSAAEGLKKMGYVCRVYLEHRSWVYYSHNQESDAAREAFESTCKALEVMIVGREADIAILQMLRSVTKSVALTNDRYSDYATVFPELVGTMRIRGFSVTEVNGEKLIAVDGLAKTIRVKKIRHVRSYKKNVSAGLCGHGNVLLEKGNLHGATRCFEKMLARHDADGCTGLSEVYSHQGDDNNADKFSKLGEKMTRRMREKKRRERRLAAESRRTGLMNIYAKCA